MEKKLIFWGTIELIEKEVLRRLNTFKKNNKLSLHKLLYISTEKSSEKLSYEEPYYGKSKITAKQTMSRILNGKGKLTDKIAEIIAKNYHTTIPELAWLVPFVDEEPTHPVALVYTKMEIDSIMFPIFHKIMEDAFLSDKYGEEVTNLLIGYVCFARRVTFTKYVNGDGFNKVNAYTSINFRRDFKSACYWLYKKMDFHYEYRKSFSGFSALYREFLFSKKTTLKNRDKVLEELFCWIIENPEFRPSQYTYGKQAYELLEYKIAQDILEFEICEEGFLLNVIPSSDYWKIKKKEVKDALRYVKSLEKAQKSMAKIGCYY